MDNNYSDGTAIPFITYNSTDQKCEKIIQGITGEFSVISIVGAYRSGKSYLLNKMLLNYKKGFSVGKTVNACTKGIWIWSKPLLGQTGDGRSLPIILLDTEGFGSHDSDFSHDSKIFTLAVLLSSFFIYNSVGVIDENVLDSLGFICNLGKIIGSKTYTTPKLEEETTLNNLESSDNDIFPELLWVLRDFTLQLLDDDGSNLTASSYLEKVLNFIPKTKSNELLDNFQENKENVRSTIKTYFKTRGCLVMVRPSNKESDLQNLDNIQDENLRPEFLSQVLSLRKKLFTNCKPKTFKGIKLNHESYLTIIKDYIDIMNSGKLPSIESIWNNLCRYETQKASDEAVGVYEEFLKENLNKKRLDEDGLEKLHEKAKELSLEAFRKKSVGDCTNLIKKNLKKKIDEKLIFFSKINEEENKNEILNYMKNSFDAVELKLKKNEINSLDDLQNEIIYIENICLETFPSTRIRSEMILDFKYKVIFFASTFIISKLLDLNNFLSEKNLQEKNSFLENLEKKTTELQIKTEENKNASLEINKIKEEMLRIKEKSLIGEKERDQLIKFHEEKISRIKEENLKALADASEKLALKQKQFSESEKKIFETKEKYEKEKAELDIKNGYLTKSLQELSIREKEKILELEMQFKEKNILNKGIIGKLDNQIKDLNIQLEEYSDKINDLENKIFEKENLIEKEKNKFEDLQRKSNIEKNENLEKNNNLRIKNESLEKKLKEDIDGKDKELSNLRNSLLIQEEENQKKLKISEENFKANLFKLEKDLSLENQNKQFLEYKCEELSNKNNELKKTYDSMLEEFEKKTIAHSENMEKNNEIKNFLSNEKKQIEENLEKEKNFLTKEIQNLKEKLNKQEEINKKFIQDLEKTNKDYKENLEKSRIENINLQNLKYKLEEEKNFLLEENNKKIKKILENYEKKNEEKESIYRRDMDLVNKNCEDTIANYKVMFENEKIRLEEKIKEEKIKNEKKIKILQDDYENKIKDLEKELKIEIENLKCENEALEESHQNLLHEAENEIRNLNQKILSLDNNLKESKENLGFFQAQFNVNIDKKIEDFNNERKELLKKIDLFSSENNLKDQELTGLRFRLEQLDKENIEFNIALRKEKDMHEDIQRELNQEITDEFNIKKLEYSRESNLLKQQIEFLNKKLDELTKTIDDYNLNIDSVINTTKKELENEFYNKIESLKKERDDLSNKFANKKKEFRDLEQAFLKQACIHDKEKQIQSDKISSLEKKIKDISENYKGELNKIFDDMTSLKDDNEKENNYLKNYIVNLNEKYSEVEKDNKNLLSKKNDMKNKIDYLENQIEDNKKSMHEIQKKFEIILNNSLAKSQAEKENLEKDYKEKLADLEHQFISAVQKIDEENQNKLFEMGKEHKELEDELNNLSRQTTNKLKLNDPSKLAFKISELLKIQENLKKELDETKLEKDQKILEIKSKYEREKEYLNIKILEYEVKLKSTNDNRKSSDNFDIEKEKLKWKSEKDGFLNNIQNLNDHILKQQRKMEYLLRENDNLKSAINYDDKISSKNSMISMNSGGYMNDKEIPLDNIKRENYNLNLNMNMISPLGVRRDNNYDDSDNKDQPMFRDLISPILSQDRFERKEGFGSHRNNGNMNLNTAKLSPYKMKK